MDEFCHVSHQERWIVIEALRIRAGRLPLVRAKQGSAPVLLILRFPRRIKQFKPFYTVDSDMTPLSLIIGQRIRCERESIELLSSSVLLLTHHSIITNQASKQDNAQ